MPFSANLWKLQNVYFMIASARQIDFGQKVEPDADKEWMRRFRSIGETLGFNLKGKLTQEGGSAPGQIAGGRPLRPPKS